MVNKIILDASTGWILITSIGSGVTFIVRFVLIFIEPIYELFSSVTKGVARDPSSEGHDHQKSKQLNGGDHGDWLTESTTLDSILIDSQFSSRHVIINVSGEDISKDCGSETPSKPEEGEKEVP